MRPLARRSTLLLAASLWFLWVWVTRVVNLVQDDRDFTVAFLAVHFVLFSVSIAFSVTLGVVGWRMRREEQAAARHQDAAPSSDARVPAA